MYIKVVLKEERPRIPAGVHPVMEKLVRSRWAQDPEERPTFVRIKATLFRTADVGCGG